jgi:hypothetical protein
MEFSISCTKQVNFGMTPREAEAVLGVPVTRADLGGKLLYKYRDIDSRVPGWQDGERPVTADHW